MPKFEIRVARPQTLMGRDVVGGDVLGRLEIDHEDDDHRMLLSMLQFGGAELVRTDAPAAVSSTPSEPSDESPFADLGDDVVLVLAEEGVQTLEQAAEYLAEHGSFEPLEHIGRATNRKLVERIEAAGLR